MRTASARARTVAALALVVAAVAGCASHDRTVESASSTTPGATTTASPICTDLVDGAGAATVWQAPTSGYPVLRCTFDAGGVSYTSSAYLFNMAGSDLIGLTGETTSASVPFGDRGNAMTGPTDAWLIQDCRLQGIERPVPMLVRTQASGTSGADHRADLARITSAVDQRVVQAAECGVPAGDPPRQDPAPTPPRFPVVAGYPVCSVLDPSVLGAAAAGDAVRHWTFTMSQPGGPVQACDLFHDGRRVMTFTAAHGWLKPYAERPGERSLLSERLPGFGKVPDEPDPGTVVGAVDGSCGGVDVAFRMSVYQPQVPGLPGHEQLFRAFVGAAPSSVALHSCAPVPANADWTFG